MTTYSLRRQIDMTSLPSWMATSVQTEAREIEVRGLDSNGLLVIATYTGNFTYGPSDSISGPVFKYVEWWNGSNAVEVYGISGRAEDLFGTIPDGNWPAALTIDQPFKSVTGSRLDDYLLGGSGDDTLDGWNGNDSLEGGSGSNKLDGDDGIDTAIYFGLLTSDLIIQRTSSGITAETPSGTDKLISIEFLTADDGTFAIADLFERLALDGTSGNDTLRGGDGHDTLNGLAGNDSLLGDRGDDLLTAGPGMDTLRGQQGNDTVIGSDEGEQLGGGAGKDSIQGAGGDDSIFGSWDDDWLEGGDGNDLIKTTNDAPSYISNDTVRGGAGNDTIFGGRDVEGGDGDDIIQNAHTWILGGEGNDTVGASNGGDTISGGDGDDVLHGLGGNDEISGGEGNDSLIGDVDLGEPETNLGAEYNDTINAGTGDDTVRAGQGDDIVIGVDGNNQIFGGSGADTLYGGQQGDTLSGGDGDDFIFGLDGDDRIDGGSGQDTLAGDGGNDIFVLSTGVVEVVDFDALSTAEKVDLSGAVNIDSYADLVANHLVQSGLDARIDDYEGGSMILKNVSLVDLDATDFVF